MNDKKAWKGIGRTIGNHCRRGHKLRVQSIPGCDVALELFCVFCGVPVAMGAVGLVNDLAENLQARGFEVTKHNNPVCSIRVH